MDALDASLEVFSSIFAGILATFLILKLLYKTGKNTWLWGLPSSALILFVMFLVWFLIGAYDNQKACEVAYGLKSATDPELCETPARGIMMMLEYPFIVTGWVVLTLTVFYKLSERKRLSPQRTPHKTSL